MTTLENIQNFLAENATRLKSLANRRDISIGFNAFALVSDTYRKENFHSDIMAAILNPSSTHGEGNLFLRLFLKYLEAVARGKGKKELADSLANLPLGGEIVVLREEGRVDIKIKAPEWTIIIENKINGAVDMERQLPRYFADCGGTNTVKAIVYLAASEEKMPDWDGDDWKLIRPLLIQLVGFSETEGIRNLVDGWLAPCELAAKGFAVRAVLAQYSELVRNQAGETMNRKEIDPLFAALRKHELDYTELLKVFHEMPHALAAMIAEKFGGNSRLKRSWVWSGTVGVLDFVALHPAGPSSHEVRFAIDIHCEDLKTGGVSFAFRTEKVLPLQPFEILLKESFDSAFAYDEKWGRIKMTFDTNVVFRNVEEFLKKIEDLVAFLDAHWGDLEKIAAGDVQ